ncbi:hypothetical protein GT034_28970 [Streptomyces sp. SID2563]|uniref:hypothetical protein n=1 Tax=Streptomyces sp. SID2563 TaxID=2690255 RepID=UPI00136A426A|nr:hypothetical protein [Streptomyces sp. SID2563]MYW12346.1 hypothetical protein [Streptomyces sp. SID2563]
MRGRDSAEHSESDEDVILEALRTALGRPPLALVADVASWPAPGGGHAPGGAGSDVGPPLARDDAVTPMPHTPH